MMMSSTALLAIRAQVNRLARHVSHVPCALLHPSPVYDVDLIFFNRLLVDVQFILIAHFIDKVVVVIIIIMPSR